MSETAFSKAAGALKRLSRTHPAEAIAQAGYAEVIKGRLKCRPWCFFGTNMMIVCQQKFIMHHLMLHLYLSFIHLFSLNHMQDVESLLQVVGFDLHRLQVSCKLPYKLIIHII